MKATKKLDSKPNDKMKTNKMREIKIEKVVLSVGGTADELEKGAKLLEKITGETPTKRKSKKRIPSLGVRPGLEVGAFVTLREKKGIDILKRLLVSIDSKIRRRQISENFFAFGIKEYIEIPGMEYQRDIGIRGFEVSVVFSRAGKRVVRKKINRGKLPKRQHVSKEEIIEYIQKNLNVEVFGK